MKLFIGIFRILGRFGFCLLCLELSLYAIYVVLTIVFRAKKEGKSGIRFLLELLGNKIRFLYLCGREWVYRYGCTWRQRQEQSHFLFRSLLEEAAIKKASAMFFRLKKIIAETGKRR